MTLLRSERLILRNWQDRDRDLFHFINSDDRVMRYFPFRRSRLESDVMMDGLAAEISRDSFGFAAAEIAATGETIGWIGIRRVDHLEPYLPKGAMEIGWRLSPEYWGKGYASEAAKTWLAFAFDHLELNEIVSFAVWSNSPSIAVMRRIGMHHNPAEDFDHPQTSADQSELRHVVIYRLTRDEWSKNKRI